MCRNIKKLRYDDRKPSEQELQEAALQFVRKISGYRKPSKKIRKLLIMQWWKSPILVKSCLAIWITKQFGILSGLMLL